MRASVVAPRSHRQSTTVLRLQLWCPFNNISMVYFFEQSLDTEVRSTALPSSRGRRGPVEGGLAPVGCCCCCC